MAAVVLATVSARCMRSLGLTDTGTAFGSISATATQYNTTDISSAVLAADRLIYTAGLLTPGHFWRQAKTTATALENGVALPAHLGDVEAITFIITGGARPGTWPSKPSTYNDIDRDNLNPSGLTNLIPKHLILDSRLFHNKPGLLLGGASAITVNADIVAFTPSGSACSSPDEAEEAVFHGAMRSLQTLDGMGMEAAGGWDRMFMEDVTLLGISPQALAQAAGQMGMAA